MKTEFEQIKEELENLQSQIDELFNYSREDRNYMLDLNSEIKQLQEKKE
jgi:peptidoglycan hydrolase CwlO-like protein